MPNSRDTIQHSFHVAIGIDQTGAQRSPTRAKPLAAAILWASRRGLHLRASRDLECVQIAAIEAWSLKLCDQKLESACIGIDSVLGLPHECDTSFKKLFAQVKLFQPSAAKFGALTAAEFYSSFLPKTVSTWPRRQAEIIARANSVFALKPYQRNIGCGSYRTLHDIAHDHRFEQEAAIWPFVPTAALLKNKPRFVFSECYPSHTWRTVIGAGTRAQAPLQRFLKTLCIEAEFDIDDADICDAVVGALAARSAFMSTATHGRDAQSKSKQASSIATLSQTSWVSRAEPYLPKAATSHEGWILGIAPGEFIDTQ